MLLFKDKGPCTGRAPLAFQTVAKISAQILSFNRWWFWYIMMKFSIVDLWNLPALEKPRFWDVSRFF